MQERKYKVGVFKDGRPTIILPCKITELPYAVWRDLMETAGRSEGCNTDEGPEVFIFRNASSLKQGEDILKGTLWEREYEMHSTVLIKGTGGKGRITELSKHQFRVTLPDGRFGWHYPNEIETCMFDFDQEQKSFGEKVALENRLTCRAFNGPDIFAPDESDV